MSLIPTYPPGPPGSNFTTPAPPKPEDLVPKFDFTFDFAYAEEMYTGLSILCIVLGLVFVLFGTRLFKYTLFVFTFLAGFALGYFLVYAFFEDAKAGLITGGILGLILGFLVLKLLKVAMFGMGVGVGFVIWLTFKALFPDLVTQEISYIILAGLCVVCGLVALRMEKVWLILATPIIGAFMIVAASQTWFPQNFNVFTMIVGGVGCVGPACYIMYGSLFGIAAIGMFIQYRYTSKWAEERKKKDEKSGKSDRRERRNKRRKRRRRRSSSYSD